MFLTVMFLVKVLVPSTGVCTTPKETPIRFGSVPLKATTLAFPAVVRSTRPAPARPTPYWIVCAIVVYKSCVAVAQARAFSSWTDQDGCNWRRSAIMPAT